MHQDGIRGETERKKVEGLCRGTLLVSKNVNNDYEFIDGVMRQN